jgi:hypothetical protein
MQLPPGIAVISTVTKLAPEHRGAVVIGASHGGIYAGYLAAKAGCRGVILHDAGVGKDRAGIGSLDYLAKLGMPAATVGHLSACIGNGLDMAENGTISHVNAPAAALGCRPGQPTLDCAQAMRAHAAAMTEAPTYAEGRFLLRDGARKVWGVDSASLVRPEDDGQIVVTASHGALLDGKPDSALRVKAFAALFNDACVGKDRCGISRLPALDAAGVASATVDGMSACIGNARSAWESGVISHVNDTARRLGGAAGQSVQALVSVLLEAR